MASKTFTATIVRQGSMCVIPLAFDPRSVFGRIRVPVNVIVNGYSYRSAIAAMGGRIARSVERIRAMSSR